MNKNIPLNAKTQTEIASLFALGFLRLRMRESAANKALMQRKALDFRAEGSIHVLQEHDNE